MNFVAEELGSAGTGTAEPQRRKISWWGGLHSDTEWSIEGIIEQQEPHKADCFVVGPTTYVAFSGTGRRRPPDTRLVVTASGTVHDSEPPDWEGRGLRIESDIEDTTVVRVSVLPAASWFPRFADTGVGEIKQGTVLIERDQLSDEVRDFCSQHRLSRCLSTAISLVKECFSSIQSIDPQLEEDHDTGERWVVIEVTVQGEVDDVLEEYDRYTEGWVTSVQWSECGKIRLSYIIV